MTNGIDVDCFEFNGFLKRLKNQSDRFGQSDRLIELSIDNLISLIFIRFDY